MGSIGELPDLEYDVIIIGAGLSGIYSLYRMKQLGLRTVALENGSSEGGTWWWNTYPGCRFDSESWSYGFSFNKELLDEWSWTEHFAGQPEILRYAEFITSKFELRQYMKFEVEVKSAHWREESRSWLLSDSQDRTYSCRFLITAMGILSKPQLPTNIDGVHDFTGESFHTARWPQDWSAKGKRIGIIGTGATGIQIIQEIVKEDLESLTVFQRRPNWSAPLRNTPITEEEMQEIRERYPDIHKRCRESISGFVHMPYRVKATEVTHEERMKHWEKIYATPGFEKWQSNFMDIGTDREANRLVSKFFADKVRERVHDPTTAEKLIPKCHGFGTRRVPLETNYFEAYNKANVRLIDIKDEAPIAKVNEKGILLETGEQIELDTIIYATGFDAGMGPILGVDFQGVDGLKPKDLWADGPQTFLGFLCKGFPNMTMVMGPHQAFGNIPVSIESAVEWIGAFIEWCYKENVTRFEAKQQNVDSWTQHVTDCSKGLLFQEVPSWMTGVNSNVKGKEKPIVARYNGDGPGFRKRIWDVAERNYEDIEVS